MTNARLRQVTQMPKFRLVERTLHLVGACLQSHPAVVKFVIIAEPLPLLQICPRRLRGFLCRDDIRIVDNLILQLPQFNVDAAFVFGY